MQCRQPQNEVGRCSPIICYNSHSHCRPIYTCMFILPFDSSFQLCFFQTCQTVYHSPLPPLTISHRAINSSPTHAMPLTTEVIVALALGVPSLLVAAAALWIAYLTYAYFREPPSASRMPSWSTQCLLPIVNYSGYSSGFSAHDDLIPRLGSGAESADRDSVPTVRH